MTHRRHLITGLLAAGWLLVSAPMATAASPALQVNPLEYQTTITGPDIRAGFVDVANPGDTSVNVTTSVQGFRQSDLAGDLAFFASDQLNQAIVTALPNFTLGPRQAVRVSFSVDPTRLPKGGVYAAIFFRTVPPAQTSATSFIAESANVGTLLMLQNGPAQDIGRIKQLSLGFLQLGGGITGTGQYQNTNTTSAPVAFRPKLTSHIWPWGRATSFTAPLVLPGATRQFNFDRPGSYLGLLPVTLTDPTSGRVTIAWVFALTGAYALGFLIGLVCIIVWLGYRFIRRHRPASPHRRLLDGLRR